MSWKIEDNRAIFSIGTVADILGVKPRVLRLLEEHGFVKPERTQNNRRLYSLSDVNYIAYLAYLKTVKKVNIAGLSEISRLLNAMDDKQKRVFLAEVEVEIKNLSQESQKAFSDPDEAVVETTIEEIKEYQQ